MSVSQSVRKLERTATGKTRRSKRVKRLKRVKRSPIETLKMPKKKSPSARPLPGRQNLLPSELKAFFSYLPVTSFWHPYFFLQYFYGCHLSEPALLLDTDLDVKKKLFTLRRLKKMRAEHGFDEIEYPADPRVVAAVKIAQRWKEQRHAIDNPFLFASNRQRDTDTVGAERLSQLRNLDGWQAVSRFTAHRMFQRVAVAVKLPEKMRYSHVLRHSRAPILFALGADAETVKDILAHSSLKMSERYETISQNGEYSSKELAELTTMGLGL